MFSMALAGSVLLQSKAWLLQEANAVVNLVAHGLVGPAGAEEYLDFTGDVGLLTFDRWVPCGSVYCR